MARILLALLLLLAGCDRNWPGSARRETDQEVSGPSSFPLALDPAKVGSYPSQVHAGGGYFYDEVLEYRVWLSPKRGAEPKNGVSDYFVAFAQYERASAFSRRTKGAEEPHVLVRQRQYIRERAAGVYEVVDETRLAEWQVNWLRGAKRTAGAIERFLSERNRSR